MATKDDEYDYLFKGNWFILCQLDSIDEFKHVQEKHALIIQHDLFMWLLSVPLLCYYQVIFCCYKVANC